MTRWFGPHGPWAAVCTDDGAERMQTPVGAPCLYCAEPIAADDEGLVQLCVLGNGRFDERAVHRECVLRQTFGGVNHQRRTCSCYGGTEPADPPGLTRRGAAWAAVAAWEAPSHARSAGGA